MYHLNMLISREFLKVESFHSKRFNDLSLIEASTAVKVPKYLHIHVQIVLIQWLIQKKNSSPAFDFLYQVLILLLHPK